MYKRTVLRHLNALNIILMVFLSIFSIGTNINNYSYNFTGNEREGSIRLRKILSATSHIERRSKDLVESFVCYQN